MSASLKVAGGLTVPLNELEIRASRSSGPGGQGVNTTDSRVEVRFDVLGSPSLSDDQRERLLERLGPRLDSRGRLRVVAQTQRSQLANREAAVERLRAVLAAGLATTPARRATKPSAGARAERLQAKRRRADTKQGRRRPAIPED